MVIDTITHSDKLILAYFREPPVAKANIDWPPPNETINDYRVVSEQRPN